jgi:hypothetical protein
MKNKPAPGEGAGLAAGWPAELLAEISAAPCRRVAAALVACGQDAIDALPEPEREALFAQLQDIIAELPGSRTNTAAGT